MKKPAQLIDTYTVRYYETATDGHATVQTLCNYLQETAENHAFLLGFSMEQLQGQGLTWVLARLHLKMQRYPRWREKVQVETWPSDVRRLFAFRDYQLTNGQGGILGCATSDWMLLNRQTLKPTPIPSNIVTHCNRDRGRIFVAPPVRLADLKRVELEQRFQVRMSDLDINQHVNNVNYIEWALESVPEEIRRSYRLSELQVIFRSASLYGDTILSQNARIENTPTPSFLHQVLREEDHKTLTHVQSTWTP